MIVHVVLFTPKADLASSARRRLVDAFSSAVREIDALKRVQIGRRRRLGRPYEQLMREDYTHAAFLEFEDLAGLKLYLEHPVHEDLATQFFDCFERALIYDFEMRTGERAVEALVREET